MSDQITRALIACGVPRKALSTTLAKEAPELREHTKANLLGDEFVGYYFYPKGIPKLGSSTQTDAKGVARAVFLFDLFRKELLLRSETIGDYPMSQAVKDFRINEDSWDSENPTMAYGLGRQLPVCNKLSHKLSNSLQANFIVVPDFYAIPTGADSVLFQSNFHQWMSFLAARKSIKFLLFSYYPYDSKGAGLDMSLCGYICNNFIPMPIQI